MSASDTLVLSKGHAASALYSTLAVAGEVQEDELRARYYKDGTLFSAHPPPNKISGIRFATGSLGHGPGIAVGLALGSKLRKQPDERVYCVVSDGELNEGSVWEAFAFSRHFKLDNLLFIVDRNNLQGFGRTSEVMDMSPLNEKLRAFGLAVTEADGHDFGSLAEAYESVSQAARNGSTAGIIVAATVKGRGMPGLADTVACHYVPMTEEVYGGALKLCGDAGDQG